MWLEYAESKYQHELPEGVVTKDVRLLLVGERSWLRRAWRSTNEFLELLVNVGTTFDGWFKWDWFLF